MLAVDIYNFDAPIAKASDAARQAEAIGFDAMWFPEAKHNPYLSIALASQSCEQMLLGTSVSLAFPRSPMVTAQIAWDLAAASNGRFILGLGTQVRAHIERRFSAEFDRPVPRIKEYIAALRAIFRAFQGKEKLSFKGDFYTHTLLTDFFSAGPIDHPVIPIYVAGVNRNLAIMAGEVCDGFHVHPLHSRDYLQKFLLPAIAEGASRTGRSVNDVALACPVFMMVGDNEEDLARQRAEVRRQMAFYGTTPTYDVVFEQSGFDGVGETLRRCMARRDFEALDATITDEMLDVFTITATWDDLPAALIDRYDGVVQRIFPYAAQGVFTGTGESRARWADVVSRVKAGAT